MAMLDFYAEPYIGYVKSTDQVCLCGALAGEILVLPPELRSRVDGFFRTHQAWLTSAGWRGGNLSSRRLRARRPGSCLEPCRGPCSSSAPPATHRNWATS